MQDFDANVILLNKITNSTDKKKSLKLIGDDIYLFEVSMI
jgi:hypothetical protein